MLTVWMIQMVKTPAVYAGTRTKNSPIWATSKKTLQNLIKA